MIDKQIIVDGCDVSGCRCLAYPELDNPMCTGLYLGCQKNNCEYKKWKRKEQECEEWKDLADHNGRVCNERLDKIDKLEHDINDLEAENEELKKLAETHCAETINMQREIDLLQEELAISIQENEEGREINAELKAENERYKKMLEDEEVILALTEVRTGERHLWYSNAQKLEQALTEIKEIAEYHNANAYCNSKVDIRKILQKCEVIDE